MKLHSLRVFQLCWKTESVRLKYSDHLHPRIEIRFLTCNRSITNTLGCMYSAQSCSLLSTAPHNNIVTAVSVLQGLSGTVYYTDNM